MPFVSILAGLNVLLALTYIGLIAIVMSYATMQAEFADEVRIGGAHVAALETEYLAAIDTLTDIDYGALGYVKPHARRFVPGAPETALRN